MIRTHKQHREHQGIFILAVAGAGDKGGQGRFVGAEAGAILAMAGQGAAARMAAQIPERGKLGRGGGGEVTRQAAFAIVTPFAESEDGKLLGGIEVLDPADSSRAAELAHFVRISLPARVMRRV